MARQRAIRLADVAEAVRHSLEHDPGDPPFTPEERNTHFRRLLHKERDRLEALHLQLLDRVPADTDRAAFIGEVLRGLERFSQALVLGGMPDNVAASHLESAGLRITELCLTRWQAEVSAELQSQELADTAPLRRAMCKVLHQARAAALHEFQDRLAAAPEWRGASATDQATGESPPGPAGGYWSGANLSRSRAPLGTGWPGRHPAESHPPHHHSAPNAPPAEWASVTVEDAARRYIASVPRAGGSAPAKLKQTRKTWGRKTRQQFANAAMLLGKAYPGPIWKLQQEDLDRFAGLLDRLPAHNHHKLERHKAMSLEAIAAEAEALVAAGKLTEDKIGLMPPTANRHFRLLRTLCTWVRARVPQMADLRWDDYIVADARQARDQRLAFTPEQGRELFSLPIWTGCEGRSHREKVGSCILHDAAYWVPLLCWYSGARREEIAKLMVDDIGVEDGIAYFNIDITLTGRIKNARSRRSIPLASEILRLGFFAFVEAVRLAGQKVLFPDLLPGKSQQRMGDIYYGRYWHSLAKQLPFLKPGQGLHAFRHMVSTALKDAEVFIETRSDLLGHATQHGMSDRYSKATSLPKLANIVEKIPVVTDHLFAHPINLCTYYWPRNARDDNLKKLRPAKRRTTGRRFADAAGSAGLPSPAKRAGQSKPKSTSNSGKAATAEVSPANSHIARKMMKPT
ncbi:site-specific integrase [Novosphingobium sp. KN65.2]|uniref:site-specific integrase n=1 Tax=Novosphingobium sp. KN65.2 TaxID=1478134 RepID=UPI001E33DEB1|nr:site-specific integrase [Novosphingobium sp. KN65.2]